MKLGLCSFRNQQQIPVGDSILSWISLSFVFFFFLPLPLSLPLSLYVSSRFNPSGNVFKTGGTWVSVSRWQRWRFVAILGGKGKFCVVFTHLIAGNDGRNETAEDLNNLWLMDFFFLRGNSSISPNAVCERNQSCNQRFHCSFFNVFIS